MRFYIRRDNGLYSLGVHVLVRRDGVNVFIGLLFFQIEVMW